MALVLSRKRGEEIIIDIPANHPATKMTVTVVEIRGDKVRLVLKAPRTIPIHRKEVYDEIHQFDDGLMPDDVPADRL